MGGCDHGRVSQAVCLLGALARLGAAVSVVSVGVELDPVRDNWLAIVAVLGTVSTLVSSGLAIRFYLKPRRGMLLFRIDEELLVVPDETDLTVVHDGQVIGNPRILTAHIQNLGPTDLSPAAFDKGWLGLDVARGSVLSVSSSTAEVHIEDGEWRDRLLIDPRPLHESDSLTLTAVAAHDTDPQLAVSLINFRARQTSSGSPFRPKIETIAAAAAVVGFVGLLATYPQTPEPTPRPDASWVQDS